MVPLTQHRNSLKITIDYLGREAKPRGNFTIIESNYSHVYFNGRGASDK